MLAGAVCASPGFALLVFAAVIAAQRALRACAWSFDHLFKAKRRRVERERFLEVFLFTLFFRGTDFSQSEQESFHKSRESPHGGNFTTQPNLHQDLMNQFPVCGFGSWRKVNFSCCWNKSAHSTTKLTNFFGQKKLTISV